MQELLSKFPSELSTATEAIKNALIEASSISPGLGISSLIQRLEDNKTQLVKLFVLDTQTTDDKIREKTLNTFYLSIVSDLFLLSGTCDEISKTLDSQKKHSAERIGKISSTIRAQESQIRELKQLRDNTDMLQAIDQPLSRNKAPHESAALYNKLESTLTIKHESSTDSINPTIDVRFIGAPERKSLPSYNKIKMFDKFNLSAWYELVSFKHKPEFWLDTNTDSVQAFIRGKVSPHATESAVKGQRNIPTATASFQVSDWISIGHPYSSNHESVQVIEVNAPGGYITVASDLVYDHYISESIFKGRNLVQANGAVAVIDLTYSYPQQINFARFVPFASSPIKVHGIFVPSGDPIEEWSKIAGSEVTSLSAIKSVTFDRRISTTYRVILEQANGGVLTSNVSAGSEVNDLTWDAIYENEFNEKSDFIERRLEGVDEREISKANAGGYRGFLVRKAALSSIDEKNSSMSDGTTSSEQEAALSNLNDYVGLNTTSSETSRITRFVYDIGLAEIQLMANIYKPSSLFEGKVINPKQDSSIFLLRADEDTKDGTSIQHFLKIESGEEVPIPNINNISSVGKVLSKNEYLEVEPSNRRATLLFKPFNSSIEIEIVKEGAIPSYVTVPVVDGRIIEIPANLYSQKYVYQATYAVEEDKVHLTSSIVAVPTSEIFYGTDSDGFIQLSQNPYIDLGIINDNFLWNKRSKFHATWTFSQQETPVYVGTSTAFPINGYLANNTYYGHSGSSPILRTPELESYLLQFFSSYSGDPTIWKDRFFNSYTGTVLQSNLLYTPISVRVNNIEVNNLSNYDGNPDTGFVGSLGLSQQYHHFSNRIKFPQSIGPSTKIEVNYAFKQSTIQYMARLIINKKSNFWNTPVLRSAIVGTMA